MKLNSKAYLLIALAVVAVSLFAMKAAVFSASSSDAIAVKIIPNPNHYSIAKWYQLKGIGGSPQSMTVDGYPAIRNGRTIYVNAASVDPSSKIISTNVYLISYNQDQAEETTDILGRIVSHWKFNENLGTSGTCSISSISCSGEGACQDGYSCVNQRCQLTTPKNCLGDGDCPDGLYCDSLKSKVIRDVKRLGMIEDLKYSLAAYNTSQGNYPTLAAGTYIPNLTLSTWPSWNTSLLKSLSLASSYVDPINRLATCPGHDPLSCWNASTSRFYFPLTTSNLEIPQDSYLFVYSANRNGTSYELCSFMESGALGYDTASSELGDHSCQVTGVGDYIDSVVSTITPGDDPDDLDPSVPFSNHAPQLVEVSLQGEENQAFNGYIELSDEDGDTLSWQLETSGTTWTGWSGAPILKDMSGNANKKLVYAAKAGNVGDYPLVLVVSDNRGGIIRANLTVKVKKEVVNFAPSIEAGDLDYYYSCASTPLNYSFYVLDDNQPITLTITKVNASPDILAGVNTINTIEGSRSNYSLSLTPSASLSDQDRSFSYKIRACDSLGSCSEKQFAIRLHPGANSLNVQCPAEARLSSSYYCRIGDQTSSCFNNMSLAGNPAGISLIQSNGEYAISGQASVLGTYNMILSATDAKGSANSASIPLKVNTYCGDGLLQAPNSEGKGGLANNGYEQCDITAGVSTTVSGSSISKQYGCVPDGYKIATSPYPITTNGYCVFGAKTGGYGGYCGDGYCQARVYSPGTNVQVNMETTNNCQADCGTPAQPEDPTAVCGNGKIDSGEICDGTLFASNSTCASVNSGTPYGDLKCVSCTLDTSSCSSVDPSTPVCGDGKVSGNESCDYASFTGASCSSIFSGTSGSVSCNADCSYNSSNCLCSNGKSLCSGVCCSSSQICNNGSCQTDPSTQTPAASCGDGIINQTSEQCDGSALNSKTCSSINAATPYGTLKCSNSCRYDTSGCSGTDPNAPVCGNGKLESWEGCEGTNFGNNTCASVNSSKPYGTLKCINCQIDVSGCSATDPNAPVCGNGIIQTGEQCDGTNFGGKTCASVNAATPNGSLKCTACQLDASGCSAPAPAVPVCGNGQLESGEECDGSAIGSKTCSSLGFAGGTLACTAACKYNTIGCSFFCPAGTKDGYVYSSLNNGGSQSVTRSACYRANGGTWTATATCNNSAISISNANLVCNSGYLKVGGAWYQENYGCYDACVYATCAAGNVSGYAYDQMNHNDTKQAIKAITNGSCGAKALCNDGTVTISEENCICTEGVYDANSKACVGCLADGDCDEGYKCNNKVCEKKCWSLLETVSAFTYKEGDVLASYGCSIKTAKDNPDCIDNPTCPSGCNDYGPKDVGDTGGKDSCKNSHWHNRDIYRCGDNSYVNRCYGDACRMTLGYTTASGIVNASGKCVYNYYCGDGICTSSTGEECSSCSQDCGSCVVSGYCGDGICNYGEDNGYCYQDCGNSYQNSYYCGDGYCDLSGGNENSSYCEQDCGYLPMCGDGNCESLDDEDSYTCPDDCGYPDYY